MVLLAPSLGGLPCKSIAARRALDEPGEEVLAVSLAVGAAIVLGEHCFGPLMQVWVHYGRNLTLYVVLAAVNLHHVDAGVGGLVDDVGDGGGRPASTRLALAGPVAPSRRGNAEVVEALCLPVERGALCDVSGDLPNDGRFFRYDLQPGILIETVAVGDAPHVLAASESPV